MDTGHSADSELIPQTQMVRMSLRPPSRFTGGTDLILWLKRFEIYVRKVKVSMKANGKANYFRCLTMDPSGLYRSRDWSTLVTMQL